MEELIAIEKLIERAKEKGVDFGKGDPYNRLRYYTKIGWIPNMKRKKSEKGNVDGHYPSWVIDRLVEIENLKAEGISNEEIGEKLKIKESRNKIKEFLKDSRTKNQIAFALIFVILSLILLTELGIFRNPKSQAQLIVQTAQSIPNQIVDLGTGFVPAGQNKIFVRSNSIHSNSKVYVAFENDYFPATRYWIDEKVTLEGFFLQLDAPTNSDAQFNWWITN